MGVASSYPVAHSSLSIPLMISMEEALKAAPTCQVKSSDGHDVITISFPYKPIQGFAVWARTGQKPGDEWEFLAAHSLSDPNSPSCRLRLQERSTQVRHLRVSAVLSGRQVSRGCDVTLPALRPSPRLDPWDDPVFQVDPVREEYLA